MLKSKLCTVIISGESESDENNDQWNLGLHHPSGSQQSGMSSVIISGEATESDDDDHLITSHSPLHGQLIFKI